MIVFLDLLVIYSLKLDFVKENPQGARLPWSEFATFELIGNVLRDGDREFNSAYLDRQLQLDLAGEL